MKEKKLREPAEKKDLAQTLKFYVEARKKGSVQCIIKQLLDSVFAISRMNKVSVRVIYQPQHPASTDNPYVGLTFVIILDITKNLIQLLFKISRKY